MTVAVSRWLLTLFVGALAVSCGRLGFDTNAVDGGPSDEIDGGVAAWTPLGGSAAGEGLSNDPGSASLHGRVGIGPDGSVYALYANDQTGNRDIYVQQWTGSAWRGLGTSADPGGISNDSADSRLGGSAFDAAGNLHVSWMSVDSSRNIYYRRWNGSAWIEVANSATGSGVSGGGDPWWPKIAISPITDEPLIAYETYSVLPSGGAMHVKTPGINGWEGIDGSAANGGVSDPTGSAALTFIAVDSNEIYVVWQEMRGGSQDIYLSAYNSSVGWRGIGGSMNAGGISQTTTTSERPTVRARAGQVVVSWSEKTSEGPRAYVRSFEADAWVELAGSASGDGVSGPYSPGQNVQVELDSSGLPFAVWAHDADGDTDIFAAGWDGSSWHYPVDPQTGLSDTPTPSDYPRVAIAGDGAIYVLWEEQVEGSRVAIYLRSLP